MFALSSSAVLVHWLANAVPCELGAHIVLLGFGGDAMLDDNEKATSRDQWPSCSLSAPVNRVHRHAAGNWGRYYTK